MKGSEDWGEPLGLEIRGPCSTVEGAALEVLGWSSKGLGKWKSRKTESMAIRAVVAMHTALPSGREKAGVVEKNRRVKISEERGCVAEQGLREEGVNQPSIKEERDGRLSEKKPYLHVADMIYLLDGPAIQQGFQTG